jgi:tetratricopeptide (TPR) repeat protein
MASARSGENLAQRLRRLRQQRGLSQRQLTGPGVSGPYICRIEAGDRSPSMKALRVIAARLGVSAECLETGIDRTELEARLAEAELAVRLGHDDAALVERFRAALVDAEALDDQPLVTRARLGLALAAQAESDHAQTIAALEQLLDGGGIDVRARPDVYTALGRAYAAVGDLPRAVELFRRCLATIASSEEVVDPQLEIRFLTLLSYALTDIGDLPGANDILARMLERATQVDDLYSLVRIYWSLARLYGVQGPAPLAVSYYRRAIATLELTEDRRFLGRAHEACASALLDQRNAEAARKHLDAAARLYLETGERTLIGSLTVEQARFALLTGDTNEGRRLALEALELLDRGSADADDIGDAWRTLAEALAAADQDDLAEDCYRCALDTLSTGAPLKYLADAYRSYADFLHTRQRAEEAFQLMKHAATHPVDAGQQTPTPEPGRLSAG